MEAWQSGRMHSLAKGTGFTVPQVRILPLPPLTTMNKELEEYARGKLIWNLKSCTKKQNMLFRRMYSPDNLSKELKKVVRDMPVDKLDWAMTQVQNTLEINRVG